MKKAILAVIFVSAITVFGVVLVHALWYAPEENDSLSPATTTPQKALSPADQPARLRIPILGIDAVVQYVGVNAKGNMGVPNNFTDVAWYKYGTAPGERGSAVIDGHVDNGLALAGVFKHLADLREGDDVYIQTKSGASLHFVVQAVALYDYHGVPLDLVFNRADGAYLNLITCYGAWVKAERTYDKRLIIFTKLVR